MTATMKSDLPDPSQHLLELMQSINFGRIENLPVRNGLPVFNPSPRIVREIKFGGENGPRPERSASNFAIKAQVNEFFDQLVRLGHGTIEVLEIKHGLPFRMMIAE